MTGKNKQAQRCSIKKTPYVKPQETPPGEYVPCPKCGTMMANTKRAKAHCKEYE